MAFIFSNDRIQVNRRSIFTGKPGCNFLPVAVINRIASRCNRPAAKCISFRHGNSERIGFRYTETAAVDGGNRTQSFRPVYKCNGIIYRFPRCVKVKFFLNTVPGGGFIVIRQLHIGIINQIAAPVSRSIISGKCISVSVRCRQITRRKRLSVYSLARSTSGRAAFKMKINLCFRTSPNCVKCNITVLYIGKIFYGCTVYISNLTVRRI